MSICPLRAGTGVYKDYPPVLGGIEGHLRQLAEGQAQRGLDVTVLVTTPSGPTRVTEEGGVRVIRARRHLTLASTPLSLPMHSWLRRLPADVVHLQLPYPWAELGQLWFGRGRRLVATYQSDIVRQRWLGRLYRPWGRRLLAACHRVLVTSPTGSGSRKAGSCGAPLCFLGFFSKKWPGLYQMGPGLSPISTCEGEPI